jgi:hypothetical protein
MQGRLFVNNGIKAHVDIMLQHANCSQVIGAMSCRQVNVGRNEGT